MSHGPDIVTGGAGFIGSHLVDKLLDKGRQVLVLDDFSSGDRVNLAQHSDNPLLSVVEADILDEIHMLKCFRGAENVYHLACRNVRLSLRRPSIVHEVNATGTLNVLKAAAASKVKRFLYCSSSEVNGTADVVPMPEDYHFRPETIYGASKLTGEYYTAVFQRAGWLETTIVRPHNNYGPREHYRGILGEVIPRFILRGLAGLPPIIYGDGLQTRDFTYVEETAEFLIRIMDTPAAVGQTLNLCRGQEVSILQLAHTLAKCLGRDLKPVHLPGRPSDVLRLFGDPSRIRRVLGDTPSVSIEVGFARTTEWFRENVPVTQEILDSMEPKSWDGLEPEPWLQQLERGF